jgi:hypothetical protein
VDVLVDELGDAAVAVVVGVEVVVVVVVVVVDDEAEGRSATRALGLEGGGSGEPA